MNTTDQDNAVEAPEGAEVEAAPTDDAQTDFDDMAEDSYDDIEKQKDADIDPEHLRLLEAVLFASSAPVAERMLARRLPEEANVKALLKPLKAFYEDRGVHLVRRGGMWAFRTATELGPQLNLEVKVGRKLSRAAIETLSIIAYHQPVTRGEIEEVRGVSLSKGTLDLLFDEGWIKPRGRRNVVGHPMQWGTTDEFLDHFGLETVKDLPGLQELRTMGLLDARPAIEAYSVRGEITAKEDAANIEITEAQIVPADREDDDSLGEDYSGDTGGETGPMAATGEQAASKEPMSAQSTGALDDAMGAVAAAVKSAAQAIERETEDPEEEDTEEGHEEE